MAPVGMQPSPNDMVIVTTTLDKRELLEAIAREAVETRLAACAQIEGPLTSMYWWKDRVTTAYEYRATFKTTAERSPALFELIGSRHPYEVPEIIEHGPVVGSEEYQAWVADEVSPRNALRLVQPR